MSWQGNELFVTIVDMCEDDESQRIENLRSLLEIYDAHGRGWYLLGHFFGDSSETEDDYDPFDPKSYGGSMPSCWCWLPNPFMHPGVLAMRVRNATDLIEVAFEGWDSHYDCFAYAGDGEEPLEHMVIYGKAYDMRAA
jgi:hypothetical protein